MNIKSAGLSCLLLIPSLAHSYPYNDPYGPRRANAYPSNYYYTEDPKRGWTRSQQYQNTPYPFVNQVNVTPPGDDSPEAGYNRASKPGVEMTGPNPNSVSPPGSTDFDPTDRRNVSPP